MKIGILQAGRTGDEFLSQHGDFDEMVANFLSVKDFSFEIYPVLEDVFPKSANDAEGWIITGSRFSVYDNYEWITRLEVFVREIVDHKKALFGICFGHQIIAKALGGVVEKHNGGWGIGVHEYLVEGFDQKICLLAWHQDQVVVKPESATLIGTSEFCRYAVLAYANNVISFQAHPEFTKLFVDDLLKARGASLPGDLVDEAKVSLNKSIQTEKISSLVTRFFINQKG